MSKANLASIVPTKMFVLFTNNLNIDVENASSWFIQNGMKPNPEKYQAMVLDKTEVSSIQFSSIQLIHTFIKYLHYT